MLLNGEVQKISTNEARMLVYALLKPSGCTVRTCDVEVIPNQYFPHLFFFEALSLNPKPDSSLHIGSWAVDPRTGDLWGANVCVEYRTAALERSQRQLRKRLRLTQDGYQRLKQRPPMCDAGEHVELRSDKY